MPSCTLFTSTPRFVEQEEGPNSLLIFLLYTNIQSWAFFIYSVRNPRKCCRQTWWTGSFGDFHWGGFCYFGGSFRDDCFISPLTWNPVINLHMTWKKYTIQYQPARTYKTNNSSAPSILIHRKAKSTLSLPRWCLRSRRPCERDRSVSQLCTWHDLTVLFRLSKLMLQLTQPNSCQVRADIHGSTKKAK